MKSTCLHNRCGQRAPSLDPETRQALSSSILNDFADPDSDLTQDERSAIATIYDLLCRRAMAAGLL